MNKMGHKLSKPYFKNVSNCFDDLQNGWTYMNINQIMMKFSIERDNKYSNDEDEKNNSKKQIKWQEMTNVNDYTIWFF